MSDGQGGQSNTLAWVLSILAVVVMGVGQLLYSAGTTGIGLGLEIGGGLALVAVLVRTALRGLR